MDDVEMWARYRRDKAVNRPPAYRLAACSNWFHLANKCQLVSSADILDCLADAHQRLSEGQGAELLWRDNREKRLSPDDALHVYALKTAPAFEVAFYSGLRLAGEVNGHRPLIQAFSQCLGVAFQILNDLKDWCEDDQNKGSAGGDVLGGRPTLLWAYALEAASPEQQDSLFELIRGAAAFDEQVRIEQVREWYQTLGVFRKTSHQVELLEKQAQSIAEQFEPAELRELLLHLVDVVLQRPATWHSMLG